MVAIQSQVIEVSVFQDRARVTRRGTLTPEVGAQQIEFADLPLMLVPDSVRASGRGTANAVLLGVNTRRTYFSETPSGNARALEQQLEQLQDQDTALADQAASVDVQLNFVRTLAAQAAEQLARGIALGRAQMEQGTALLQFTQEQLTQAQSRAREIAQQRRELARQIAKVTNDLNSIRSSRPRERYATTVEVEVKQAGDLTLDLTYIVNGAAWQALYDVRANVEGDTPSVQWSYLAQVTNSTGEDWNDVALTLSTARPALTTISPELTPWYLDRYVQPQPAPAPRMARSAAAFAPLSSELLADDSFPTQAAPVMGMYSEEAHVSGEGSAVTFKPPQRVTVPSDGSPHKVNITTLELKPKLDYLSVPKLVQSAYRRATITNTSDFLLLAGNANLFVGGDFVGTMPVKLVAPNEEFEFNLGVDDRVYVERKLMAREVDKRLIGDRRRVRVGYEIELRNLRTQPIVLELHDQLPVARHEQIKVKLESADPKSNEQSELNELTWNLTLAPNEHRFVRFDFTIEHPTSFTVTDMP